MKRLITFLKGLQVKQVLSFLFAGLLVLITTACSPAAQAMLPGESNQGIPGHRSQPYEGGINGYSDTDSRRSAADATATKVKAKGLKDNAQRNLVVGNDLKANVDRTLDRKAEDIKQLGKNLKQGAKDLGNKVDDATDDLRDTTGALKDNIRSSSRELSKNAKQAADNVQDNVKDTGINVIDTVKTTAKNTAESVKGNLKDASNAMKSTAQDAANSIKDAANSIKSDAVEASKPSGYYSTSGSKLN